jgi:MFS family permease
MGVWGRTGQLVPERDRPAPLGRAFWRLWSSSTLSNLADGVVKVSLPLVAVTLTDSPGLVAGVAVTVTLPWLLFALPAGAVADRVDRRAAMLVAEVARASAFVVLVVTVLLGYGSIWVLYAVAGFVGIAEVVYDTCAQSILPQVVSRERLSRANGRLQAAELTANEFVGPPLGGLLVGIGIAVAFAAPAGLWAVAVGVLLLVRGQFRVPRERRTTIGADVAEGLRFLWRQRLLRTLAAMTGLFNLGTNAVFAVFVVYAVGPGSAMRLSEAGYGLLVATIAAGSLLGALVADRVERRVGRSRTLALGILGGVGLTAPALTADPLPIAAAFLVGGVTLGLWNVVAVSLRQRITPDRILGRVNSGYRLVAWGSRPLGAAAGGLIGQTLGLRVVFAGAGALILLTLLGMVTVTDAAIAAAEQNPRD